MVASSLIATPETDAKLRREFRQKGADAKKAGVKWEDCPYDGMIKLWWREGWDGMPATIAITQ